MFTLAPGTSKKRAEQAAAERALGVLTADHE